MKSEEAIIALAALAQESRLAVFRLLVKRGPEGYTPTATRREIEPGWGTDPLIPSERAATRGLIEARRDGRFLVLQPKFPRT